MEQTQNGPEQLPAETPEGRLVGFTAKEVIIALNAWADTDPVQAGRLWRVLTALRGPDDDLSNTRNYLKTDITMPLRAPLANLAKAGGALVSRFPAMIGRRHLYEDPRVDSHFHFFGHAAAAAEVLEDMGLLKIVDE